MIIANPSTVQCILLGTKDVVSSRVENTDILSNKRVKILGAVIDFELKFDEHVIILCRKAAQQLIVLKRRSYLLDEKARMSIYRCFILSNVCSIVWHLVE